MRNAHDRIRTLDPVGTSPVRVLKAVIYALILSISLIGCQTQKPESNLADYIKVDRPQEPAKAAVTHPEVCPGGLEDHLWIAVGSDAYPKGFHSPHFVRGHAPKRLNYGNIVIYGEDFGEFGFGLYWEAAGKRTFIPTGTGLNIRGLWQFAGHVLVFTYSPMILRGGIELLKFPPHGVPTTEAIVWMNSDMPIALRPIPQDSIIVMTNMRLIWIDKADTVYRTCIRNLSDP